MRKKTARALVATFVFLLMTVVTAALPAPVVLSSPGGVVDLLGRTSSGDVLTVSGPTYPTSGRLLLPNTEVTSVEGRVTLVDALAAWARGDSVLLRSDVYPAGVTAASWADAQVATNETARMNGAAAALLLAKRPISQVPQVSVISETGPAYNRLAVNDIVLRIDGVPVHSVDDVTKAIASRTVGDTVEFTLERDDAELTERLVTTGHQATPDVPVVGAAFGVGYQYDTKVTVALPPGEDPRGSSLPIALAVYDKVTPGGLLGDLSVAAVGRIDGLGAIEPVERARDKMTAARAAGASVLIVPQGNCADLPTPPPGLRVVPVTSLSDAVGALDALQDPARAGTVKGCS